ncbi:hypothetical protein AArcSl_1286 [Halalkaliarchaeum desulfuricum]|uniref:Uncharacterized protein n=1 Tax=Halalkaliarchaeum desulfuricum TaxID=2055893 RepID=A0A343TIJ5_9EURY|nr:hypothetical protein AArcSl_1286 [Halalkaliarchaeum desulfuricum]
MLETELDDSALMAFISDAHNVVNRRCEPHTDDEEALADVETYVAAHLATAKEPRVSATSGAVTDVELDADGDRYWHQAVLLDPTGRLDRPQRGYCVVTT